jgi:hypothetical protein
LTARSRKSSTIFQFSDREIIGIVVGRDEAVSPGEDADVKIAGRDIGQAFIGGQLIFGCAILHICK